MHALWRELGQGGEEHRDRRLGITSNIVRRQVESSATLTGAEADAVIAALDERKQAMARQQDGER